MKKSILIIVSCFLLFSCTESGKIKVCNKVHNVKLENISFGKNSIYHSLLPGETSDEVFIFDDRDKFQKINPLEFYMVANGNRVYLKTKAIYSLDYDQTLLITVYDTTEVINPLLN